MRPHSHLLASVLVGILVLTACGDAGEGDDPAAATTTPIPATLPGSGDIAVDGTLVVSSTVSG